MQTPDFPVPFMKMSGTGNDFILIDHRNPLLAPEAMADFAAKVCRRKFSVGADGLILIENSSEADFQWQFFNADGSVAEMCGNGARCAARFAFEKNIAPAHMRFQTLAGEIEARMERGEVKIRLTPPVDLALEQSLLLEEATHPFHSLNTGVPHAVFFTDDLASVPVVPRGRAIRHHGLFQPAGTNVNFVQVLSASALHVRTYERGGEDETMACGTGAVAAALVAALQGLVRPPVAVTTSGGERLTIHFALEGQTVQEVYLQGPALMIYEGQLAAEGLRGRSPLPGE